MSVYTSVSRAELEAFLQHYPLGELVDFNGISAGIENTNYFVSTTRGDFVLTLFEILRRDELPYYLQLMAYLNEHDLPCAHPVADDRNHYVHQLNGKPATIMQRLQGKSVVQPGEQHCRAIGTTLARMHLAGAGFPLRLENSRGGQWRQALGEQLLPMVNESDARILQQELYEQAARPYNGLPRGVIHADLFRDNALFVDHQVSGVVDFYNACDDDLVYDVAITVNDWCVDPKGSLDFERAAALCQAYQASRPLCDAERRAWPMMLRRAALRFWLSRLWDWHHPKSGELTFQKDPDAFKDILLARRQECDAVLDLWAC